ncbi:transglutaminase-like putative cysteine protease [Rhodopirellula rubra]|uniref:Transglutaminase-like putative cysteine protease n=1 Tax=Aporhodopirellula rubra TaxID=980271 RepID=A0A7W5H7V4_9BACT|nr:transglutaminase family protein [Aporhodopirellula rubra]MBB3208356.1 transglutaminase-like putative cysteine protease [Aporhodopirellula rubra]
MVTETNDLLDAVRMRASRWGCGVLTGLVVGLMLCGCDLPDRHDIAMFRKPAVWEVEPPRDPTNDVNVQPASLVPENSNATAPRADWQFWYLHHVDPDGVIGGGVMQSQRTDSGQIKLELSERTLEKFGGSDGASPDASWQFNAIACLHSNEQVFWHSDDGQLSRIECRVRRGPLQTSKYIEISGDEVRFDVDHLTSQSKKRVIHHGALGGPLAVYQSLLGNPLRPREVRESKVLLPIQETLATLQIRGRSDALAKRMTEQGLVLDSLHEAVAMVSIDEVRRRERYYWYDDDGVVQATNITGESRFTYRCDEDQYRERVQGLLQDIYPISIEVPGKPIPPGQIRQLALNIEFKPQREVSSEASEAPPISKASQLIAAPRQYVQDIDETHQRVITANRPVSAKKLAGRFDVYNTRSFAADSAVTQLVDFRSAGVRKVLNVATSMTGMSDQEKAIELNRTVHSLLSFDPLSVGLRSASAVAGANIADSTEHAILLIAMLRAKGVPARMCLGMRYLPRKVQPDVASPETNRFVYHAWVIAKAEDDWISLDATTGAETAADCIALAIDDLSNIDTKTFVNRYLSILKSMSMSVSAAVVEKAD